MNAYQPFVAVFARQVNEFVVFNRLDSEISIPNPDGYTWEFLCKCNGQRTLQEICEKFPASAKEVIKSIFITLKNEKIIFDSREMYKFFHDWSSVPMSTYSDLTEREILELCKQKVELPHSESKISLILGNEVCSFNDRRSVRDFTGEPVTLSEVSKLLFAMYGKAKYSAVPSAGGMYASIIYAVVLKDGVGIDKGVYAFDNNTNQLLKINSKVSVEKLISLFGSRSVKEAGVIFFITSNVSRVANKYSNRSYRFALLEAGHIAQNAHLAVAGTRLGLCEYGGFLDGEVSRYLEINDEVVLPLISIVVGVKSNDVYKEDPFDDLFKNLQQEVVVKRSIVDTVTYTLRESVNYKMSVYVAETVHTDGRNKDFSLGSGLTPNEAMFKALAESYERHTSSVVRIDHVGELSSDKAVLNLWAICPQNVTYLNHFGMVQEGVLPQQWTKGLRYLGGDVYVPTDQVYFPVVQKNGQASSYISNSTGVATHQTVQTAVESAFYELVERDAIGVHWYSKKTPDQIDPSLCSDWLRYRVNEIEKIKRKVVFLKLTIDLMPVVMCVVVGETYPYFVSGSASAATYLDACDKALTEAEITLVSFCNKRRKKIEKEKVWSVEDHAKFLAGSSITDFGWFLDGDLVSIEEAEGPRCLVQQYLEKINPVIIHLNRGGDVLMPVVRVMSEKLLPITFGYGSEHYGHPRLKDVGLSWGKYPALPHPLA